MVPAPGGGIEPLAPRTLTAVGSAAVRVMAKIPQLPRPLADRVIRSMPRAARPSAKVAKGIPVVEEVHGGVPCTWLAPELSDEGVLVFCHGGSYLGGPVGGQWAWLAEIQRRLGIAAVMVLYRMPPDHPFPAALDDASAAIRAMHEAGKLRDGKWILGGDSAGGGLALATAQALRDAGSPLPAGLVLTAPWVDIEMDHPCLAADAAPELMVGRGILRWAAERYADGVSLADPRLSPINGAMRGLPPAHLNVGTHDLFLGDNRRLCRAFEAEGVAVECIEQSGAPHTYPQNIGTAEAEWTIRAQVRWIRRRLDPATNERAKR